VPHPAANGFVFQEYSALALSEILRQACDAYRRQEVWKQLVKAGMGQDWTWARSAKQYVELYQKTIERGNALVN
jgi:starch synthase